MLCVLESLKMFWGLVFWGKRKLILRRQEETGELQDRKSYILNNVTIQNCPVLTLCKHRHTSIYICIALAWTRKMPQRNIEGEGRQNRRSRGKRRITMSFVPVMSGWVVQLPHWWPIQTMSLWLNHCGCRFAFFWIFSGLVFILIQSNSCCLSTADEPSLNVPSRGKFHLLKGERTILT